MRFPIKTVSTIALAWVAGTSGASAHEYWLEPVEFTVPIGQAIQGNLKNGQDFKGSNFSYIPKYFEQFTISGPSGKVDVKGRSGDLPALNQPVEKPGLYSVSYQGTFDRILFTDSDKIKQYIEYEGLDGVLERNAARGYPDTRLQEQYARCAKALFQVGDVVDGTDNQDQLTGMKFELVAEKNPYQLTIDEALPVRLYWENEPIANVQIRIFQNNGEFSTRTVRTNAEGRAVIPLAGGGKFMLNAVKIYEGDDDPQTELAEWVSYWASLTFGLTDTDEVIAAATEKAK